MQQKSDEDIRSYEYSPDYRPYFPDDHQLFMEYLEQKSETHDNKFHLDEIHPKLNYQDVDLDQLTWQDNQNSSKTEILDGQSSPHVKQAQRCSIMAFAYKSSILDLVSENVRNRYLTVFVFLLAYIYVVFTILGVITEEPLMISDINTKVTLSDIYKISKSFQHQSTYPRLQLQASNLNEGSRYPPIEITIFIEDFVFDQVSDASRDCSHSTRVLHAGTLDYFRLYEVCRVILKGNSAFTNRNGEAVFNDFAVQRGPQGRYYFAYKATDPFTQNSIKNPGFVTYFESEVTKMVLKNLPSNFYEEIILGEPLEVQPAIQLLNLNNQPVKGRRVPSIKYNQVVAFTWGEPELKQKSFGLNYDPFKDKFGLLSGFLSEESDDNGVAHFKNLTIEAFTSYSFYLYFSCDNVVLKGYGLPKLDIYKDFNLMTYQFNFKKKNIDKIQIQIIGTYSRQVTEGKVFENPIKLQIINMKTMEPIEGLIIITTINDIKGVAFVKGYEGHGAGYRSKQIIKPISAFYSNDSMNPFSQNDPIVQYKRTNSSGMIVLDEIYFSIYGNQDSYKLEFWANGASTRTEWIKVKSTVSSITILQQPDSLLDSQLNKALEINFKVQIKDNSKAGVPGKQATISLVNPKTYEVIDHCTVINSVTLHQNRDYSDQDGILSLKLLITFAKEIKMSFKIMVSVDGVFKITDKVTVKKRYPSLFLCGSIYFTNYPNSISIGKRYSFGLRVLDQKGDPLSNQYVILYSGINYNHDTLYPQEFIPILQSKDSTKKVHFLLQQTNEQGEAQFEDVIFLNGHTGKLNMFAITASIDILFQTTNHTLNLGGLSVSEFDLKVYLTLLVINLSLKQNSDSTYITFLQELSSLVQDDIKNLVDSTLMNAYRLAQYFGDVDESQNPFQQIKIDDVVAGMLDLCSFCEAKSLIIQVINPISQVLIIYPKMTQIVSKGLKINVTILILDNDLKPAANIVVFPQVTILKAPDSVFYRYTYPEPLSQQIIKIISTNQTDMKGRINLTVEYLVNDVGLFMGIFDFSSITSMAFPVVANHSCQKITILSQPNSNQGSPVSMGNYFKGFRVQAFDSMGNGIPDIPVMYLIEKFSKDSNGRRAFTEVGSIYGNENLVTMDQFRLNSTNEQGVAHFDKVTAAVVESQNTCLRFVFQVGDHILQGKNNIFPIIQSNPSNLYCFYNNLEISIMNLNTIDSEISPKSNFVNPPQVLVAIRTLSDIQRDLKQIFGGIVITAYFYDLYNQSGDSQINQHTDSLFLNNYHLADWYCSAVFGVFSSCNILNITFDPELEFGYQALTIYIFSNLNWKLNKEAQFQLSLSDSVSKKNKTMIDLYKQKIINHLKLANLSQVGQLVKKILSEQQINFDSIQYIIFEEILNLTISKVEQIKQELVTLAQQNSKYQYLKNDTIKTDQLASIIEEVNKIDPILMLSLAPEFYTIGKLMSIAKKQVSALFGRASCMETSMITVNYNPSQILIEKQPPQIIYVQELFSMTVMVKSQDFPISDTNVKVGLSKPNLSSSGMSKIDIIQMVSDLATGGGGISSMQSYMRIGGGAQLDPNRISVRTDKNGRATFNLKFIKGMNAFYKIGTESFGISGDSTYQFKIMNHIKDVKLKQPAKKWVLKKNMVDKKKFTIFPQDLVLELTYEDGFLDDLTYPKNVEILFFSYSQLEQIQLNFSNQTNSFIRAKKVNFQTLTQKLDKIEYSSYTDVDNQVRSIGQVVMDQMSQNLFSSFKEMIGAIKRVIMTGGELFLSKRQAQLKMNYRIGKIQEKEAFNNGVLSHSRASLLRIQGLRAQFKKLGVYQIIVSIDGIQSQVSGPITVKRQVVVGDSKVLDPIIGALILLFFLIIIYFNFFQTEEISIIQRIFFQLKQKNKDDNTIHPQKIIFEGATNKSVRKRLIIVLVFGLGCVVTGGTIILVSQGVQAYQIEENTFSMRNLFYYISFFCLIVLVFDSIKSIVQSKSQINLTPSTSFVDVKYYCAAIYMKRLYRNKIKRAKTFKDQFMSIFKPMYKYNDEFIFFPQKIITSMVVSLFSVVYIIYQLSLLIRDLCIYLEKQALVLQDGYSDFISTAINQINSSFNFTVIFEEQFNQLYEPIKLIEDIIYNLISSIKIAFILSLVLGVLTYAINQIKILCDFRQRVIRLRQGIYQWDENPVKINLATSAQFVGAHVSFSVIGMSLTTILLTIVLTPVFFKYTWILLWEQKIYILTILVSPVINAILKFLLQKQLYRGDGKNTKYSTINRALHSCAEILFLYSSICAGIAGAIARAFIMIGVIIFNSSVTYMSIYPQWISHLAVSLDMVVHAYLSTIRQILLVYERMHNLHNNPVLIYFVCTLVNQIQEYKSAKNTNNNYKLQQIRNKFWVATLIHKNQTIRIYRKGYRKLIST